MKYLRMKNIPTLYMESFIRFVRVFYKHNLNIFSSTIIILKNKNTPYTIYGKLGVKSFTFLYDLSNESQNITKKDMPPYMTYLSLI